MRVPNATVPTSKASAKTVAQRNQTLHQLRDTISGGDSSSQMQEILSLSKGVWQKSLEANLTVNIPPEHGVAMKADLALPVEQAPNLAQVGISSQSHYYQITIRWLNE